MLDFIPTLDQMGLTGRYRTFYLIATEKTFFSNAHGIFSRKDHIISHKTSLSKFKKIEIISSFYSNHNGMELETNNRRKARKSTHHWKLNKYS